MIIKVGITGQSGFIGSHLYNYLKLCDGISFVDFSRAYFMVPDQLHRFVSSCDVIIHLAGLNRHDDTQFLYDTNLKLVEELINACQHTDSNPHIIFSSSTQEERDNFYGRSKLKCRELLETWAGSGSGRFTGLIIPNVFGPFGRPNYNSVVATFCHQLVNDQIPETKLNSNLNLIYINELVEVIQQFIRDPGRNKERTTNYVVPHTMEINVSELLNKLMMFKELYFEKGTFPTLQYPFDLNLFNTFRCFIPAKHYPVLFTQHKDDRGSFTEIVRTDSSGQFSFSTTRPGITRGNHFHTRKAERFAVIQGKARIQIRKTGSPEIIEYYLDGKEPAFVDMPIWHTHNITNVGTTELLTLFWINEPFNPEDPDTFFEDVEVKN